MRLIFSILIVSLLVTGFSAAAHAFGDISLNEKGQIQMADESQCHKHQDDGKTKEIPAHKKQDMNCHYCCAALLGLPQVFAQGFVPQPELLVSLPLHYVEADFVLTLLRPPKSLV